MTTEELAHKCADAIGLGLGIVLVLPGDPPSGVRVRLSRGTRTKCPMGEVLSWTDNGTIARFDPIDVLAWLAANQAVQVVTV